MKIIIHDKRKIQEIQREFSEAFPMLRIDFFDRPHKSVEEGEIKKLLIHPSKTIGECRTIHPKGDLAISPQMKVSELVQGFGDSFGLHAKVFHKVGNDWLEAATDSWTLEKQNAVSSEMNAEDTLEII